MSKIREVEWIIQGLEDNQRFLAELFKLAERRKEIKLMQRIEKQQIAINAILKGDF